MRDYAKVSPRFWTGETGRTLRSLGPQLQVAAMYLMTCPSATMTGLYYLPLELMAHESGLPLEGASEALARLSTVDFAYYDPTFEYVFVVNMAEYQVGETLHPNDKRVRGIRNQIQPYVKSRLFDRFLDRYNDPFHLGIAKPQRSPFVGSPKPGEGEGAGEGAGEGEGTYLKKQNHNPTNGGGADRPKARNLDNTADDLAPLLLREFGIVVTVHTATAAAGAIKAKIGKEAAGKKHWTVDQAFEHIKKRMTDYTVSPVFQTPARKSWDRWLTNGDYDAPDTAWQVLGKSGASGTQKKAGPGSKDASTIIEDRRKRMEKKS